MFINSTFYGSVVVLSKWCSGFPWISLDFPGFPQPKVALVKVFFTVDNENRQLEDLSLADFGRVPELISSVVKDKVSKWEFCL